MEYTKEMIEKAETAESAGELLELARENGIEMSAEEADVCFAELHPQSGELSDEELENVSGGGCYEKINYKEVYATYTCEHWKCVQHNVPAVLGADGIYSCPKCWRMYRRCEDCYYLKKVRDTKSELIWYCRYK